MLVAALLNRWSLSALNLIILFPLVMAIGDLAGMIWGSPWASDMHKTVETAENLIEGLGVVLIGWGVALEERDGLADLLGSPFAADDHRQSAINHICHAYGLAMLVVGLFAEIAMECVKLPDHIINTYGLERWPLTIATAFLALGAWCLFMQIMRLVRLRPQAAH